MADIRYCELCNRNVEPTKKFNWLVFIFLCGIFYLPYYLLKSKGCPICGTTHLSAPHNHHGGEAPPHSNNSSSTYAKTTGNIETAAAATETLEMNHVTHYSEQDNPAQQAQDFIQQYFTNFGAILQHPFRLASRVDSGQFLNGIITLATLPFFFTLMYFISGIRFYGAHFYMLNDYFIKPFFSLWIILFCLSLLLILLARLGEMAEDPKTIIARFGNLMIPVAAFLPVGCLLALIGILKLDLLIPITITFMITVANLTALTFKAENNKVDLFYLLAGFNFIAVIIFYSLIYHL